MNKLEMFKQQTKIIPSILVIDICASCNADCLFCARKYMPQDRAKGYMDYSLFEKILLEAKELEIKILRLYSTAEPTLHPDFEKFIKLAKSLGFYIELSTNASTLIKNKEALSKVDSLQYSIEGWDKKSYELYRYPLKFDKTIENINIFQNYILTLENKPEITINLLINKVTNISAFTNLWSKFADRIVINSMLPSNIFKDGKFIFTKNSKLDKEYLDFEKRKDNFYCDYLFEVMYISFDGKISLCCRDFYSGLDLGNVSSGLIKQYNSKELNSVREEFFSQKLYVCRECSIFFKPKNEDILKWKEQINSLPLDIKEKIFITGK